MRLARDVSAALIGGLTRELLQLLMMSVTLALLSPRLFAIFVGGIAPLTLLLKKLGGKLQQRATASLDNHAAMTEWLQQRLLGIETIKHYRTENLERQKFAHLSQTQFKIFLRTGKLQAIIPQLTEALTVAAMAVALYFALQELQHTSTALMLAFFSTLALLAQSASRIGRYFNQTREGNAAIVRVFALQTALAQNTSQAPLLTIERGTPQALVCDNITVQLSQQTVLKNFSYRFDSGMLYGLRGVVGAGKSTLLKAILGLLPLQQGRIFLQLPDSSSLGSPDSLPLSASPDSLPLSASPDSLPLAASHDSLPLSASHDSLPLSASHDSLPLSSSSKDNVALWLPQKLQLRAGDVAGNVCYPHAEADSERLVQALTSACVPQEKWQSIIDFEHAKLSGGQEQRLGIARLFYHPAPLVLIDEGTSALDQQTEQQVLSNIKALARQGTIVIMAAHRSAALAMCDRVVDIFPKNSSS